MTWLNYHHLLYFWTVAREGSIVRAAEQLHLTQPTISGQIKALEDALGERLFERQGRAWCSPRWGGSCIATPRRSSRSDASCSTR